MLIKKKANSYNDYNCEFSWGQLCAFRDALADSHANPVADELFAGINWFFDNIPGPGESEDDLKKEEEAAESGMGSPDAEGQPLTPKADDLLPAPPEGEEGGGMGGAGPEEPGGAPGGEGEGEDLPGEFMAGGGAGGEGGGAGGEGGGPGEGEEPEGEPVGAEAGEADRRLPRPPEE